MLTYAILDQDVAHVLFLENMKTYSSISEADLAGSGNTLFAFKGDNVVFVCDLNERWGTWCDRQKFIDKDWGYKLIEHPYFCGIMERWIRLCLHKGATEGSTGWPKRMLRTLCPIP